MKNSKIRKIKAREILDSRGNPTVEVVLVTEDGIFQDSVPSGASTGKYEAVEIRDGEKRYQGRGVLKAVKNVNEIIAPKIIGKDPRDQKQIDNLMLELDGTENKSKLGANAILAVSMAVCRAGADFEKMPLYNYISQIFFDSTFSTAVENVVWLPVPCFNIINGGSHAGNELALQEFIVIPQDDSFSKNLQLGAEIYHQLKEILRKEFGRAAINIGDEGGFAPSLSKTSQALDLIVEAINQAGYKNKTKVGLDCAASQFKKGNNYQLEKEVLNKESLLKFYQNLLGKYPIIYLEDPFGEDDWEGWQNLKLKIKNEKLKILIIGDDLLVTNSQRIKEAEKKGACNALLLKINQIGTITEALAAARLARDFDWQIVVSHRSGETIDDFIADFSVGIRADFIKAGAPARGERVAKYNRLLRIEEELRSAMKFQSTDSSLVQRLGTI